MSEREVVITIKGKNLSGPEISAARKGLGELRDDAKAGSGETTSFADRLKSSMGELKGGIGGVLGALGPLGPAIAGAFSVGAIVNAVRDTIEFASHLKDLSAATGIGVERLQALTYALSGSSVSIEDVSGAVAQLGKRLVEGDKSAVGAMDRLGLSVQNLVAENPDDAFLDISDAIKQIQNPMEQSTIAMELFGRSGAQLLPALKDDLRALVDEGRRKATVDKELIDRADALGDAWGHLKLQGKALLAEVVLPLVTSFRPIPAAADKAGDAMQHLVTPLQALKAEAEQSKVPLDQLTLTVGGFREFGLAQGYIDGVTLSESEMADMAREAAAKSEELRKAHDQLFGLDTIESGRKLVTVLGALENVSKLDADAVSKLHKTIDDAIDAAKRNGEEVPLEWYRIWDATNTATLGLGAYLKTVGDIPKAYGEIPPPPELLGPKSVLDAERLRGLLIQNGPGVMLQTGQDLSRHMMRGFGEEMSKGLGPAILGAVQGGGNAFQAAGGFIGGKLGEHLGKDLSKKFPGMFGSMLDSVLPGVGTLVGAFAGKLAGFFADHFFGGEGKKANKERDSWVMQIVGINDLPQAQEALSKLAIEAGATDTQLRALFDAHKVTDFHAAQQTILDLLDQQKQKSADMASLNDAMKQKQDLLNAAVDRYHFTLEELGPALRNQKLGEQAEQLLQDFGLLTGSGIKTNVVIGRMGESINDFVHKAIATGTEVPEAMRPMLEAMIKQGTLTDAAGHKITDLKGSGISFGETLTQGFKHVVDKLDQLIQTLTGKLPHALDSAADVAIAAADDAADHWQMLNDTIADGAPVDEFRQNIADAGAGALGVLSQVNSAVGIVKGNMAKPVTIAVTWSMPNIDIGGYLARMGYNPGGGGNGTSEGRNQSDILSGLSASDAEAAYLGGIANAGSTHQDWDRVKSQYGFHTGGWIGDWPRAHSGLWLDEMAIIGQTGERVLARAEVDRMGGRGAVDAYASGRAGGASSVPVNLYFAIDPNGGTGRPLDESARSQIQDWFFGGRIQVPARAISKGTR